MRRTRHDVNRRLAFTLVCTGTLMTGALLDKGELNSGQVQTDQMMFHSDVLNGTGMMLPVLAKGQEHFVRDGISYKKTSETTVEVYSAEDAGGKVKVPVSITFEDQTYQVTSIAKGAFTGLQQIQKVQLPEGLETIENNAFAMCTALTDIILPATLTSIKKEAFSNCVKLQKISLPASLETIGESAFDGCIRLEAVQIPASVTKIGSYAFFNCPALKTVVFEGEDVKLGRNVFDQSGSVPDEKQTSTADQNGSEAAPAALTFYGPSSRVPVFLEAYARQYKGKYLGENLNEQRKGQWIHVEKSDQYMWRYPDGTYAYKNWVQDQNDWYFVSQKGFRQSGWKTIDGQEYFFDHQGRMQQDTWIDNEGDWYYFDHLGHMVKNAWQGQYYLDETGKMARNRFIVENGTCFYVDGDGKKVTSASIPGYTFDENGRCMQIFMDLPETDSGTAE